MNRTELRTSLHTTAPLGFGPLLGLTTVVGKANALLVVLLNALQAPALVLARLYVAHVFFSSGLTKLRDWDITLALFQDEYKVPLLSPEVAAAMGTFGEIVLPIFLVLGLGSRIPALGLFVVNVVAVLSLSDIAPAALQQHITWGVLLAALALFGSGKWSADAAWCAWHSRRTAR
jgi:putative oxidoreductase